MESCEEIELLKLPAEVSAQLLESDVNTYHDALLSYLSQQDIAFANI